ncbi:MAG: hypothetical protein JXB49_04020 [Bacteroidales bacterium]|nr:hypothetical protein [Bacteroidales bacterium]
MRNFTMILVFLSLSAGLCAQELSQLESLLPVNDITKVFKQVMGVGSQMTINIIADTKDYDACEKESVSSNGLDIRISWFDMNGDMGNYYKLMLVDMKGAQQQMDAFKSEKGFNEPDVTEEDFMSGKLWYTTNQEECINTISGPTGAIAHSTHMGFSRFDGNVIMCIEVDCKCKIDKAKEMISTIVGASKGFDFAKFKDVIASE